MPSKKKIKVFRPKVQGRRLLAEIITPDRRRWEVVVRVHQMPAGAWMVESFTKSTTFKE